MQIPVTEIKTALADAQQLVKFALNYIPGTTNDEKTAALLATIEPVFKEALATLNLAPLINQFAAKLLEWVIAAEVKAAELAV
jgi:hypothetical protein